jgi:outer membrane protein with glycine zipper
VRTVAKRKKSKPSGPEEETRKKELTREAAGAVAGAAAGAAIGAIGGPPGLAAGAAIGAVAGAMAEKAVGRDQDKSARNDARLDAEIGVSGGELGAPNLRHPPGRVGAYSGASVGAGQRGGRTPAEGPISEPEDED